MSTKPYIIQTGMGADLHGADDTKAACRAVQNAIQHNSMLFLKHAGLTNMNQLLVEVTIASPSPERVDIKRVKAELPIGTVVVKTQKGGLKVDPDGTGDSLLIANAAITVSVMT